MVALRSMTRRFGPLMLVTATAAGCVVSVDSQAHIVRDERRFTVSGTPNIRLSTFDGAIEVRSWDGRDVLVEIEKRGPTQEAVRALEVIASQDGDRIQVEVRRPSTHQTFFGLGLHALRSAKLIASVPRQSNVMARTGDGSIKAERLAGRVELRTGDGSIRASDLDGEVTVHTGDGSVVLEGLNGRLDVTSGDGGVSASGVFGRVRAETGDGSVTLRAEPGSTMSDDWSVTTGDGGVLLYLPGSFNADLDAHTGDGTIRADGDLKMSPGVRTDRRTIRGTLGAGGRVLKIRTGDGSINLRHSRSSRTTEER